MAFFFFAGIAFVRGQKMNFAAVILFESMQWFILRVLKIKLSGHEKIGITIYRLGLSGCHCHDRTGGLQLRTGGCGRLHG
jgi:hypothetical protein